MDHRREIFTPAHAAHQAQVQQQRADRDERLREVQTKLAAAIELLDRELDTDRLDLEILSRLYAVAVDVRLLFSDLVDDSDFWAGLRESESATAGMSRRQVELVRQVVHGNLGGLLDQMGHVPPPSSQKLAGELRDAFVTLFNTSRGPQLEYLVQRAQYQLCLFSYHLRSRLDAVAARLMAELDPADQGRIVAQRLHTILLESAHTAGILATLASAGAGFLLGVGGLVPEGALDHGGDEAVREVTKNGITVAASLLLARLLPHRDAEGDRDSEFEAALRLLYTSCRRLESLKEDVDASYVEPSLWDLADYIDQVGPALTEVEHWAFAAARAVPDKADDAPPGAIDAFRVVRREVHALCSRANEAEKKSELFAPDRRDLRRLARAVDRLQPTLR